MAITYRMTSDSLIEQQDDDGVFRVHVLDDTGKFGREKTLYDDKVERWHSLAADNALRIGVPEAMTKAFIFSESGGDPKAHGPQSDYGIGLMMITHNSLKQGLSNEEVFVPENNVRLGTDFLRTLAAKIGGSYDPVQISSMYNCGPGAQGAKISPGAPWGVCEYHTPDGVYTGYISKIVRAYNYGVLKDGASSGAGSSFFKSLVKVVLGIGVLAGVAAVGVAIADPELVTKVKRAVLP